jgi:rhomboid protease GluP
MSEPQDSGRLRFPASEPSQAAQEAAHQPSDGVPPTYGTLGMIALNAIIFGLMAYKAGGLSFSPEFMLGWGADYTPLTIGAGQVWRLVSSTFLHFGLGHIASNMLCLYYWGPPTERAMGLKRWVPTYVGLGVAASLSSVLTRHDVVSAGASGSIAGLLGLLVAMRLRGYPISTQFLVTNLLLNIGIAIAIPVDWVAHLGGFLAGVAAGLVLIPRIDRRTP